MQVIDPFTFSIGDTSAMGAYQGGATAVQVWVIASWLYQHRPNSCYFIVYLQFMSVLYPYLGGQAKVSTPVSFLPLAESLAAPEFMVRYVLYCTCYVDMQDYNMVANSTTDTTDPVSGSLVCYSLSHILHPTEDNLRQCHIISRHP